MKTYIVTGYYGSGKTEFCVNLALELKKRISGKVYIADMDIINPFFRSREKEAFLKPLGIEIVGNALDNNTGQDIPAVSYGFLSLISSGECVIIDLAGSEAGLRVLAQCYDRLSDYEFLCTLNLFRAETGSAKKMIEFVDSVNSISQVPVTGVINNGHMLRETEPTHVLESQKAALEACNMLNIPLRYTQVRSDIYSQIENEIKSDEVITFDELQMRERWQ